MSMKRHITGSLKRPLFAGANVILIATIGMLASADVSGGTVPTPVIGLQKVVLEDGNNYIGTPFDSVTSSNVTLSTVLDSDQAPAAGTEVAATAVAIWDQDGQALTNRYWLSNTGGSNVWRLAGGAEACDETVIDRNKGLVVTLPTGEGPHMIVLTGLVSTQGMQQVVVSNGYTLASSPFPAPISLADSGLISSGFMGGTTIISSDNLLFFNTASGHFDVKLWYDSGSSTWRNADTTLATQALQPGESFLIRRRARSSNMIWSCACPYTLE
jgi:hypothetical protein